MKKKSVKKRDTKCRPNVDACGGGAYFLGMLGALIYYMSTATGFWSVLFGIFKALFWPAFLVFEVLKFIN